MADPKQKNRMHAYERDIYDPDAPEILRKGRDSDLDALTRGLSAENIRKRKAPQGGQAARGVIAVVVALAIAAVAIYLFVSRQGA